MESTIILVLILAAAVLGKANSVALATCILLLLKLVQADQYAFPFLQKNGLFLGIVILVAAVLIPIANGEVKYTNILNVFTSWVGIIAFILALFTSYLSGLGVEYLTGQGHSEIMPALILGSVIAAAFFGGVPVGPLITSGLLVVVLKALGKLY